MSGQGAFSFVAMCIRPRDWLDAPGARGTTSTGRGSPSAARRPWRRTRRRRAASAPSAPRRCPGDLAADDPVDRAGLDRVLLTIVTTCVAELGEPSRWTPSARRIHWVSEARVQVASPWPPSESNSHEWSWPTCGSHPRIIRLLTDLLVADLDAGVSARGRPCCRPSGWWSGSSASRLWSTHSPTIHSSSLSRSAGGTSSCGAGRSRISAIRQASSFFAARATNRCGMDGSFAAVNFASALDLRHIGREEADRFDGRFQRVARRLGETGGERRGSRPCPALPPSVHEGGVLGEELGQARGVPAVIRLDVARQPLADAGVPRVGRRRCRPTRRRRRGTLNTAGVREQGEGRSRMPSTVS